jgi:Ni,Fe-hydrogenase III large subunit
MYAETSCARGEFARRVAQAHEKSEPVGAYATGDRVSYVFVESDGVRAFTTDLQAGDELCLAHAYPLYDWDEREMRDALFSDDRLGKAVVPGRGVCTIVVGPVHAGIIEPGQFTFGSDGETIVSLGVRLGYSRRGVEESLEGSDAVGAARKVARVCGGCSAARSWAYARALEALAEIECSEAAELARLTFAELERAYNHIFDLASICAGAGYAKGQIAGLGLKERLVCLNQSFGGHRFLFDAIQPGGVRLGVLAQPAELRRELAALRPEIERYISDLLHNGSLMKRLEGSGKVSFEDARRFGAVGPSYRASGGRFDVRTALPYGAYRTIVPVVASAAAGDVAARAAVKQREALESLRLADRALEALGNVGPGEPKSIRPAPGRTIAVTEGPRGMEAACIEVDDVRTLSRVHFASASYRNWPVVALAASGSIVPEFPLINKSFNLCYACADR